MKQLTFVVAVLALIGSWAVLSRVAAGPELDQSTKGYMPLIVRPPRATNTPTATVASAPTATATATVTATVTQTNVPANCHPSYPGVCIPPPPPDLNCGDITFRRFTVIGSDPHNFDTDGDGIGCEGA